MTPPSSSGSIPRRPALPMLNIQSRHVPVLEPFDASDSTSQLRSLSRLAGSFESARTSRISESYAQLMLLDAGRQGQGFLNRSSTDAPQLLENLRGHLAEAQNGDLQSMFRSMTGFFALTHRMLENAETRDQVPALLAQFRTFARQFVTFVVQNPDFTPEQRFQYLYRASGIVGNILGRSRSNEESQQATAAEEQPLKDLLGEFFTAALNQHRQHLLAHPNGTAYTPIVREIQMRQALVSGDDGTARQRARELLRHLAEHPPGEADPNHPETRRWDVEAARQLQNDPEFANLVHGLDSPTRAENATVLLNGVSQELLVTVCSGIDLVNGDSEAVITDRYRSMSSVIAVLSLARPAATLSELITALADSSQQSAIQAQIEALTAQSSALNDSLTIARGSVSLTDWIHRAQGASAHVVRLRAGAGSRLLGDLFRSNERYNPVSDLAEILHSHPQLLAQLGLSPEQIGHAEHEREAALELYRRGSYGIAMLQAYQTLHPNLSLAGIMALLQNEHLASEQVNSAVNAIVQSYHVGIESRPDHEVSALHGVFRVLGQTTEIGGGITLDSRLSTHSQQLAARMESNGFRFGRAFTHVTSASSLGTMAIGLILSELAPAALIYRAGRTGTLVRGITWVRAGNMTLQGSAVTGFGTGIAMSAIGSGLQNYERASYGLDTHFWGDFGRGSIVNGFTFAGTMALSNGLSRALAPRAATGREIGQLGTSSWLRRFSIYGGTVIGGSMIAMGANAGMRRIESGHWSAPSFEEVAENAMTLLAWEAGSAGLRGIRRRYGLRPGLEGRQPFEPIVIEPIQVELPTSGRLVGLRSGVVRASNWMNRFHAAAQNRVGRLSAGVLNPFFTVLGEYRANVVRETARSIVERNPQLLPLEDAIAHRIATEEATYPGSLEQYTESFLRNYQLQISGDIGQPTLQFTLGSAPRSHEGYNARVIRGIREHLESCSPNDPDYLPRYLPRNAHELVQIRIDSDPNNPRIVGVGTHTFHADVDNPIVLTGSFDPQTRTLRLPPLHGEGAMQSIDMGPMFDAHHSSPLPMGWNQTVGTAFLQQRTLNNRNNRVPLEQVLRDANRDAQITLPINADTGELLPRLLSPDLRASDLPPEGTRILRLSARYNNSERTLTIDAPRGQEGHYVIHMEDGRIEHVRPESSGSDVAPRERSRPSSSARSPYRASEVPSTPELLRAIAGQRLTPAQITVLRMPAGDDSAAVPVTVYFGNTRGRVLGITRNHQPEGSRPFHRIAENLNRDGGIPRRRAWQGTLNNAENTILLRVPAEGEQPAGTLRIDLTSGEIRFEAEPAAASRPAPDSDSDSDVIDLNEVFEDDGSLDGDHGGEVSEGERNRTGVRPRSGSDDPEEPGEAGGSH